MNEWKPVRCWWCGSTLGRNANCHGCRGFNRRVVLPRMAERMTDNEFLEALKADLPLMRSAQEQMRRDADRG